MEGYKSVAKGELDASKTLREELHFHIMVLEIEKHMLYYYLCF